MVNMSCDLLCLIICQFIGNKKRKTVGKAEYANYSFKVKNKNVTMLHNFKYFAKKLTSNDGSKYFPQI